MAEHSLSLCDLYGGATRRCWLYTVSN